MIVAEHRAGRAIGFVAMSIAILPEIQPGANVGAPRRAELLLVQREHAGKILGAAGDPLPGKVTVAISVAFTRLAGHIPKIHAGTGPGSIAI